MLTQKYPGRDRSIFNKRFFHAQTQKQTTPPGNEIPFTLCINEWKRKPLIYINLNFGRIPKEENEYKYLLLGYSL